MKEQVRKLYSNDIVRYVFFGGCTTLVNLATFFLMRKAGAALQVANITSIILAVLFAYVVNSRFVFQEKCETLGQQAWSFCKFVGARAATMVIEVGGVWLLIDVLKWGDMPGKLLTQFIVLVLNYVFSKFLVFTRK